MQPNDRACVAYVAGHLVSDDSSTVVFDHSQSKYISIRGTVSAREVDIYDYNQRCQIAGSGNGEGTFTLYHYGNSNSIRLVVKDNNFIGYDCHTKFHFFGTVNDKVVELFDHQTRTYYNYNL